MTMPTAFQYLDAENIHYQMLHHPRTESLAETAVLAQIPLNQLARVEVVELVGFASSNDFTRVMMVIPADCEVFPKALAKELGCKQVNLLSDAVLEHMFSDCEVGAEPPFGHLYGMNVLFARELFERFEIVFKGGNHETLVRMNTLDFCNQVRTQLIEHGYGTVDVDIPFTEQASKPWRWL
ncbi:MAG: YbaK/EbsC family protein [Gammaproteobacteria bacterium]|nr:YbaK/EbsC family protein [Gammaproteobacteria bacterium]NVK87883.1 YbaK/EbsC family protein [Gammaproteobacteria bacterium]